MSEAAAAPPADRLAQIEDKVERALLAIECLAADWAAAQSKAGAKKTPAGPALIVSKLRRIDKGRLLGSCDLYVSAWHLHLRDCLWQRWEDGRETITLAEREFTDKAGTRRFQRVVEFGDSATFNRFCTAAVAAIHAFEANSKAEATDE